MFIHIDIIKSNYSIQFYFYGIQYIIVILQLNSSDNYPKTENNLQI